MNAKFILLLLVVTTTTLLPDAKGAEIIRCSGTRECYAPCQKLTGCLNAKCMNKACKCYGCV
uniref:Potassium channel toxin alpha-KTx 6.9 n=1 Tax=Opistophthalmus carinatus TaxID=190115 RepID=KAX69_OPICA|nr:RecName: Full=Potassium channel toxin alpha-KTx 6.9; AltName: Full=OcKTx4; Flags: Precursor [Opistophthalmus carinatus]AAP73820.1 potassium channel toxin KTx4 [Opistophthalmus carinatus]